MRVDVFELGRTAASVQGALDLGAAPRLRESLADERGSITFRFDGLIDDQGRPGALLRLDGEVRIRCDRCGEPLAYSLDHAARFQFVDHEAELARLPVTVDDVEALIGSASFDLAQLVEDEVILILPLSPRHERCGAPVRAGDADERPNAFAMLRDFEPRRRSKDRH